ncbi:MAG: RHS repeat-associated core domain-containing protein, partial [Bellilinea sp.]
SGNLLSSLRYSAFGEVRATSGTTSTDYRYTGQRNEAEIGLYYYVARFYDPVLERFVQADTIVPNPVNPLSYDRYVYVNSNPINFNDPSGHMQSCADGDLGGGCGGDGTAPYIINKYQQLKLKGPTYHWEGINQQERAALIQNGYTEGEWDDTVVYSGVSDVAGTKYDPVMWLVGAVTAAKGAQLIAFANSKTIVAAPSALNNYKPLTQPIIKPWNLLRNEIKGTGLQTHHIIEQRLAPALGQTVAQTRNWLSVSLTPEEHQIITNQWRSAIGYITSNNPINTTTAKANDVWMAAQRIYAEYPARLEAARRTIFGN